jgi:ribosomal protein S18
LRDTIAFGYSRAKEAGRLPREYMIEDIWNMMDIVFPNNLKSVDVKENDVVKDYLAKDFRFDPNSITKFMKHYQRVG